MKNLYASTTLILVVIGLLATSCANSEKKEAYTLFQPSQNSLFNISFEYPSDWNWTVRNDEFGRWKTMETTYSQPLTTNMPPSNVSGDISITVNKQDTPSLAEHEINIRVEQVLMAAERVSTPDQIKKKNIIIDNHEAQYITVVFPSSVENPARISVHVFLLVEKTIYMFWTNMDIKLREASFGKGFDYMIRTIRILE